MRMVTLVCLSRHAADYMNVRVMAGHYQACSIESCWSAAYYSEA